MPKHFSYWTDSGLQDEFGMSLADAEQNIASFIGQPPIQLKSMDDILVTSGNAKATIVLALGISLQTEKYSFVYDRAEDMWKIDGTSHRQTPVPAGTTVVPVQLQEYAFVYDKSLMSSGNVALQVANVGTMEHELVLAKINVSTPLLDLLQQPSEEGPPAGVDVLAQDEWAPGEGSTMVFSQPLAPGPYAFLCFLPGPNGTPHALLGMTSEFTVGNVSGGTGGNTGNNGGGTISPPNTGDAGLVPHQHNGTTIWPMLGLTLVLMLGSTAVLARDRGGTGA